MEEEDFSGCEVTVMDSGSQPEGDNSAANMSEGSSSSTTSTSQKRKKKYTSPVWNFFEKNDDQFASCIICDTKYQHSNNTSNLDKVLL